jgi:hypothetical protein
LFGVGAVHPRFDIGADHARSSLGAQRQRGFGFVAIGKRVHLLRNDIGGLAGRTLVKLDPLQQRNPNLADRVALHQRARPLLDIGQRPGLRPKHILKAL